MLLFEYYHNIISIIIWILLLEYYSQYDYNIIIMLLFEYYHNIISSIWILLLLECYY
jgi:hypothetical protein